ncbi:acyltransferase family protein [Actinoplanes sp. CA-015351]|uniref:acyltransferase family protein n=1 Tax=Actinoplanes sp. CA-015351 TaxID=3239897 RepID=UPI003D962440
MSTTTKTTEAAAERKRPRLEVLDGLRLVAALVVLIYHYSAVKNNHIWSEPPKEAFPTAHSITFYGWLGVNLFFLISGFVICMSSWGRSLGDFFTSRAARLYPAYWFAVVAAIVVQHFWPEHNAGRDWLTNLVNFTMLQEPFGYGGVSAVFWTLWTELRFYLLFALFVVWRGVTYKRVVVFCCVWTVASVMANAADTEALAPLLLMIVPDYSFLFIAGIACYLMYRFGPNLLLWGILGMSFILGLPVTIRKHYRVEKGETGHMVARWPTAVIMFLIFAVMVAVALGWLSWIHGRWLTVLGTMTYPLYLLHETVGGTLLHELEGTMNRWVLIVLVTLGLLVASWLVHRWIEKPLGLRLRSAIKNGVKELSKDVEKPEPVAPKRADMDQTQELTAVR